MTLQTVVKTKRPLNETTFRVRRNEGLNEMCLVNESDNISVCVEFLSLLEQIKILRNVEAHSFYFSPSID